jgi:hypothetical protein
VAVSNLNGELPGVGARGYLEIHPHCQHWHALAALVRDGLALVRGRSTPAGGQRVAFLGDSASGAPPKQKGKRAEPTVIVL